jgi:hypothetical protein
LEEIHKYFGLVHINIIYNHVFNENPDIAIKVEDLWIVIHHKLRIFVLRIISLGMARRVVMDLKGQQMNWAMYTKWTNQEQQRQKDSLVKLMNDEEDDTKVVDEGGNLHTYLTIYLLWIISYLLTYPFTYQAYLLII